MQPKLIAKKQTTDKRLQQLLKSDKSKLFAIKQMEGIDVIHYKDKVYVPYVLQLRMIAWYHEYLSYPGNMRKEEKFPMQPKLIAKKQTKDDKRLQPLLKSNKSNQFSIKPMEGVDVIHYKDKVYVPYILQTFYNLVVSQIRKTSS